LKILNVNNILDPVTGGGTAERTFQLSQALEKLGHNCRILTIDINGRASEDRIKIDVRVLPCLNKRFFIPSLPWNIIDDMVSWADIIQLTNHWTVLNAIVFRYARRHKKPYIVCPAGSVPIFGRSQLLKSCYDSLIGRRIIINAGGCVAISQKEANDLQSYYNIPGHKLRVIPNGVNPDEYIEKDDWEFRRKFGLNKEPFILFMGRLNSIKGPDLLIEAFKQFTAKIRSHHNLVLAGPDGGLLLELKKKCMEHGIDDRVHFIGYIGGIDKSYAYHAADFLVIPSRQEAMSIVVLESGAAGLPVLITDRCGFNDIAGIGGGIVTDASPDGIYNGLVEMLGNRELLSKMGENLRQYVFNKFIWDNAARLYVELFKDVLNKNI